jgi:hypothetical protein
MSIREKALEFLYSDGDTYGEDRDVVLEAMKINPFKYEYAYHFFNDKEIMLLAVRGVKSSMKSPLSEVTLELTDDKEFVKEAVSVNASALEYASPRLKNDKEIVLIAVNKAEWTIQFASDKLRDDLELGQIVYKKSATKSAVRYLSARLQLFFSSQSLEVDGVSVVFLSVYSLVKKKEFLKEIKKAFEYIKASKVPNFKKTLNRNTPIYFGEESDLINSGHPYSEEGAGYYSPNKNSIFINTTKKHEGISITIVHEFAHALHHTGIVNGFRNDDIINLYKTATMDRDKCQLANLPKLGSPLANILAGGYWQWTVRKAYEDYYLKQIFEHYYIYKNKHNQEKVFTKQQILKMITCPSEYASKNEKEFFAEMATLITINAVKPSQKVVAYKFILLVNYNLKT